MTWWVVKKKKKKCTQNGKKQKSAVCSEWVGICLRKLTRPSVIAGNFFGKNFNKKLIGASFFFTLFVP